MEIRKLDVSESGRTRKLWEKIFSEDGKAFLDYYYFLKTRDNEIYVLEEEGEIRSMLHLNPYRLNVCKETFLAHYVVGVATEKAYRGRGFMRTLLIYALEEMHRRREWFTFLMPAAEEIYTPYDFRFIYAQAQGSLEVNQKDAVSGRNAVKESVLDMDATLSDAAEMAAFFEKYFAGRWQVRTDRDESYYQRQIFEQQSEGGGVRLLRAQGGMTGMFFYSREGDLEIVEPLYLPEYEAQFQKAVRKLAAAGQSEIKIYATSGPQGERKPTIMARLLHPESVLSVMRVREGCDIDCSFAVLDPLLVQNSRIWRIRGGAEDAGRICVRETEDSEGVLTIAALTSLLFGVKQVEEVEKEEGVFLSAHLRQELKKLQPLNRVFLNEVV